MRRSRPGKHQTGRTGTDNDRAEAGKALCEASAVKAVYIQKRQQSIIFCADSRIKRKSNTTAGHPSGSNRTLHIATINSIDGVLLQL